MSNHWESRLPVHADSFNQRFLGVIRTPLQPGTTGRAWISCMLSMESLPECCSAASAGDALEYPAPDLFLGKVKQDHEFERGTEGCQGNVQSGRLNNGPWKAIKNEGWTVDLDP